MSNSTTRRWKGKMPRAAAGQIQLQGSGLNRRVAQIVGFSGEDQCAGTDLRQAAITIKQARERDGIGRGVKRDGPIGTCQVHVQG